MGAFTSITTGVTLAALSFTAFGCSADATATAPATGPANTATVPTPSAATSAAPVAEMATLTPRQLAGAVLFGCADSRDRGSQMAMARAGVAGIVLLGDSAPPGLKRQLRTVVAAAPKDRPPVIASDEEGGAVQRLGGVIYPLPTAETMGTWPDSKLQRTSARYGRAMHRLGVDMSLAPVADLRVPGSYIDDLGRGFSNDPRRVGRAVVAWSDGLESAGVTPVVKHWPGHGHARDTHQYAAVVPPFAKLQREDLVPFQMAFDAGVDAVMVAHVQSKGLTAPGVPASQSPTAMRVLRAQAGPDVVIMTDSLSMAAASSARGLSESEAVIASLRAGTDWAMVCSTNTNRIVKSVAKAIKRGTLDRDRLTESATRIRTLIDG